MSKSLIIESMQYAKLPDLHDTEALSEDDVQCLTEVRDVMKRHGKLDRFALHLVHKHFNVDEDEIMCEFTDEQNRTLTIKPVKKCDVDENQLVETTWKIGDGAVMLRCIFACYPIRGAVLPHVNRHSGRRA
jgi:hypothetical protein